jgi:hypothetical protein
MAAFSQAHHPTSGMTITDTRAGVGLLRSEIRRIMRPS